MNKEIVLFYLSGCPYCRKAKKAIDELLEETPAYSAISIRWIEESLEPELAACYDYYNVPTIYYEGYKLYEAKPFHDYDTIKDSIRKAFDSVLAQ